MKKSLTFYLKTTLLIFGAVLIIIAGFSPVQIQLQFTGSGEFEDAVEVSEVGSQHILWYVALFWTALIFSVGYFFTGLANKILVYVFIALFVLTFLFFSAITLMTWGATPFVPQLGYGYLLLIYGSLLVLSPTIISVHRKTTTTVSGNGRNLLDEI